MRFLFPRVSDWLQVCKGGIARLAQTLPRRTGRWFWLPGLFGAVMTLVVVQLGWSHAWSLPVEQLWFRLRGPQPWDSRLVLVKIDQASLEQLGWFPWSRDRYQVLLNQLSDRNNVVTVDLIFSEETPEDEALAAAMVAHGQVVLSQAWTLEGQPWRPVPPLVDAAIALGDITRFVPLRQLATAPVILQPQGRPSLALATAQAYGLSHGLPELPPLDQSLQLNWPGPVEQLPQYSFGQVLTGDISPDVFADKIVLVGVTAQGLDDVLNTPFNGYEAANGIHFHAALLHTLLQNNGLRPLSLGWQWFLAIALGPLFGALLLEIPLPTQLIATGVFLVVFLGSGWLSLAKAHLLLPGAWPLVLLISTALGAILLRNIRLERRQDDLLRQATVDVVTQIKNRNYFDQQLQIIWQQSIRQQGKLSLLLCDIDYFKAYNDYYGHPAGDRCLQAVAQTLETALSRATDWVARYGGEEFVVVLPGTDLEGAIAIAERIQAQLRQRCFPHLASPLNPFVTMSMGVATAAPLRGAAYQNLIDEADRALYLAKQQGRNGYVVLRSPVPSAR